MRCEVRFEAHQVYGVESGGNKNERVRCCATMSQTWEKKVNSYWKEVDRRQQHRRVVIIDRKAFV